MVEISTLIKKAPPTLKKLIYRIVPFDRRYGQTFVNTLEFLNNSSKWSKEELTNYQFEQFKLLIEHCYENLTKIYYAPPTNLFKTLFYSCLLVKI